MAKTLQLQFTTELGKTASLSIENPKEPIDPLIVKQSMAAIVEANVFNSTSGAFTGIKGASLVDRSVETIPIS
ncbi:DUF2922 domain-containing protein [Pseudobacillus wudalianchiensis]|uniref:DUF2922 domain-containing protein n=1 Tax=Pseudobacillus wudalianchiensis TaxID=1743143 RepID=A0A1B9ABZ2_9BACI|nr:DUF2922 domain-containing protein [Bacillus wudalianchiensis]OCA81331.1 hypothetical protein A8F95_16370 [Bacillus wudalianchiensis]